MRLLQSKLEEYLKSVSRGVKALRIRSEPRVFTIFCHGTSFDRTKETGTTNEQEEIVTKLSKLLDRGKEAAPRGAWTTGDTALDGTHLVLEGPGSDKEMRPGLVNPLMGTGSGSTKKKDARALIPAPQTSKGTKAKPSKGGFRSDFYGDTSETPSGSAGAASGKGWGDNVLKAATVVGNLVANGVGPDFVNIIGWSRGGITCLRVANKLYEVFGPSIRVNIFACDPVMGKEDGICSAYAKGPDMWTIPPNVDHYLAVLAKDEYRANFRCVGRDRVQVYEGFVPQTHFVMLPGNHGFVANTSGAYGTIAAMSGHIAVDLAYKFLAYYGTPFDAGSYQRLDAGDIATNYDVLVAQADSIRQMSEDKNREQNRLITGGVDRKNRGFYPESALTTLNQRCDYTPNVKTYLNHHHMLAKTKSRAYSSWRKAYAGGSYIDDVDVGNAAVVALKQASAMLGFRLVPGAHSGTDLASAKVVPLCTAQAKQTPLHELLPNMFAAGEIQH